MDYTQKRRQSLRLKGFDYSQPRNYFVTICTHKKRHILGAIEGARMVLSPAGKAVLATWLNLPRRFAMVAAREFVIMPNHVHAILGFLRPLAAASRGAASSAPTAGKPTVLNPTLGSVIRAFKSLSAMEVNRVLGRTGEAVWQRNYYEHIVRNADEYERIRAYILKNPMHWDTDPENV